FRNAEFQLPNDFVIQSCLKLTGYKKIQLSHHNSVFLPEPGMSISFAAIGKGYAADQVKKLWKGMGLENGVISAAGDLCTLGHNASGNVWKIGVANPLNSAENIAWIPISDAAIATSGDYEQYFMFNHERYSHTINPVNGKPCKSLRSVSVISPSAELSDALATAVYVLGIENGLFLINQLPGTHTLIVDEFNKVHLSENSIFEYEK
ncbi:MAG: FAD:protein FMN transferase, partial [Chitinophagaceae bacterium]